MARNGGSAYGLRCVIAQQSRQHHSEMKAAVETVRRVGQHSTARVLAWRIVWPPPPMARLTLPEGAGGMYDPDTGLVRFGARDYDPEVRRWTAEDQILADGGDPNFYGYALGNPVAFIDMDGLQARAPPPARNFRPGAGGNSAQARRATRDFIRRGDGGVPDSVSERRDVKEFLENADAVGDFVCVTTGNCVASEIKNMMFPPPEMICTCGVLNNPDTCPLPGSSRHQVGPPGYSPVNDPDCRCVKIGR